MTSSDLQSLLQAISSWAGTRPGVAAVLLVGSHARGSARPDSDLDLVILADSRDALAEDPAWTGHFGKIREQKRENWGAVLSLRTFYENGPEVEFSIAGTAWAHTDPVDSGTWQVLGGGARILWDPRGILKALIRQREKTLAISRMNSGHVQGIFESFRSWNKTLAQYDAYFMENVSGQRLTLVAEKEGRVLGYGNLLKESYYGPFKAAGIPEINDLNVVTAEQGKGIGREIIRELEAQARAQGFRKIGIGAGLGPDYAKAQRLYPRLGYLPDGLGKITTEWGDEMHLIKLLD
jgi:GNAT superfamily N-acetyltransferase